ncbi:hypothetical protein C8R44DRAFT_732960 [Mycena epipterygia]|nr:hypothetical protein C8R44DRAFT_732960 [Mycena epipterygia]
MTSIPTLCDVPVSAVFNGNAASSSRLDWVMNSGVRTQNSRASGLLSLPCDAGVMSMFLDNISVGAALPSDLVLGLDWFRFVCNSTSAIVVYLSSGPLELRHHHLPTSAASGSSSVAPVFRGDIGADPSSSSPMSRGGLGVVSTHSSTPCTRGVAACTLADLQTPRTRGVANLNNDVNMMPLNNHDLPNHSVPLPDPFVRLVEQEKITVYMCARDSSGKLKGADILRNEFLAHHCTEVCLILKSEAALARLNPISLSPSELQHCELNLGSNLRKRKSTAPDGNVRKRRRSSVEVTGTPFPIILSQDEKDETVIEFRQATDNASLKRYGCLFCGKFEKAVLIKLRLVKDLDISLLERAVVELRVLSRQPRIESFDSFSLISGVPNDLLACVKSEKKNDKLDRKRTNYPGWSECLMQSGWKYHIILKKAYDPLTAIVSTAVVQENCPVDRNVDGTGRLPVARGLYNRHDGHGEQPQ